MADYLNVGLFQLASGTEDGEAMLVNYNWYIAPLHNPDGYEYTVSIGYRSYIKIIIGI